MTVFTRTSPTNLGLIPEGFTEIGGVVLDLIGINGTRVTSQLAASSLFEGFFDDGTPEEFRGNPGTIGIQTGFSVQTISALGGGLSEVAVRLTVDDGDTASGDFDFNLNELLLNDVVIGNFSDVATEVTSSDGQTVFNSENGFGDNTLNTGWFFSDDVEFLTDFFETLSSGTVSFKLSDVDPFDNRFDFTQGIDGEIIDVGSGPNVDPVARRDQIEVDEDEQLIGSLFADNGNGSDTDADGDPLEIVSVNGLSESVGAQLSLPSGALLTIQSDGSFSFDTNGQFDELEDGERVVERVDYAISDGRGGLSTTSAEITVNGSSLFEVVVSTGLAPGQVGQAVVSSETNDTQLVAVSAQGGLIADPLSRRFDDVAFVLIRGDQANDVQSLAVDVKGTAGPGSALGVSAQLADIDAITDVAARTTALQPNFVETSVSQRIEANLVARFGETIATLTTALGSLADQFQSFGLNSTSATAALAFGIEAAGDFGSLEERGQIGSLGQGWSSLADIGLAIDGTSVQLQGLTDVNALRALTIDSAALYTVSNSAGRSVALSGDVLALAAPSRPLFEQSVDGQFRTISAFDGSLVQTSTGFAIELPDGDALLFDTEGDFLSLDMSDGRQIVASHDGDMQIMGLSGPNGSGLTFARDTDGKLQSAEDADGRTTTFAYDSDGQLETVTRPEGQSTFEYNADGDLTKSTAPGDIAGVFTYDTSGRLDTASYGNGAQTEDFAYDDQGSLTITDGAGRTTEIDLLPGSVVGRITDGSGGASEIIYGDDGNISGVRAPDGTETDFEFDDQGRLTKITDANGAELGFTYGETGENPTSFTDAGGSTRSFDYDAGGRITEATWPDGTTLQFAYDSEGNLTGYTNRRGDDVEYTYDARGRLLSESDSSTGPTTYTYDARGRLTSATNDQGTTSLAYDSADRVMQIDYPTDKSLFYTYNDAGLRASMSDGGDYNVFYDYDALGRLTGLRDEDSQIVAYEYDGAGNLLKESNGNGTVSLFSYDDAGRLTRIENQAPDASINSFNAYTYDAAGQRVTNETQDGTWTYGYDAIGQLTSADFASTNSEIADKSLTYEYDAAGNRTRVVEDGMDTLYSANALNQYTQVGDATFTYDADGNMTSRTDGDGTTSYSYDLYNRLTSMTEADGTVFEFEYDVFGNRVAKTVDGTETEYLVDPFGLGDVVSEFTGGSLSATYAHGLGLAAGEIGGVDAFYDADAVGTVTTLTSTSGEIQNSYIFTPFGAEIFEIEGLENSFEYNGILGVSEDSDALSFMRARSYVDEIGRFLSEDPLFVYGDITNLNRYAFNDPASIVDPDGEAGIIAAAFVGGVAAIGGFLTTKGIADAVELNNERDEVQRAFEEGKLTPDEAISEFERLEKEAKGMIVGQVIDTVTKSKYNLGKGPGADVGEAIADTALKVDDAAEKAAEVLKDTQEPDAQDPTPPELEPDSPFSPPIPKRKPSPDVPIPERKPVFDAPPIPARKPADLGDSPVARSKGEPHLTTFDGLGYSFQAVGEFVLVSGEDFEIQVRYAEIRPGASVATAVATEIDGNRVAVYGFENDTVFLAINGTAVILAEGESIAVGNGSVHFDSSDNFVVTNGNGDGFTAHILNGREIGAIFNDVRPFLAPGREDAIEGLLGDFDGDGSNDLQLADGTVLGTNLASTLLYGDFAGAWRITQEQSFFDYAEGESTETFTDRNFPERPVTLDTIDPAIVEAAREIVRATGLQEGTFDFDAAVFDVAVTGDPEFATNAAALPLLEPEEEVEVNIAPVAGEDTAEVDEDGTVDIVVLDNDTDFEGDALSVLSASNENGGVATVVGDQVRFTSFQDFNGETTVTYQLGDSAGNVVSGAILVNVTPLPDAPQANDDGGAAFTTNEDTRFTLGDFIANDIDPDGDTISLLSVDGSGLTGALIDNGDGTFDYDPGDEFQTLGTNDSDTDSFSYQISDGTGFFGEGTVTISVEGVNDAPTAVADTALTDSRNSVSVNVLENDRDPENDALVLVSVSEAVDGIVEIVAGELFYTPNANFVGSETLLYTIEDNEGASSSSELVVTVAPSELTLVEGTSFADEIDASALAEQFELLAGNDTVTGTAVELDGDTINDLEIGDLICIEGYAGDVSLAQTANNAVISLDGMTLELLGDFGGSSFEVTSLNGKTTIQVAGVGATQLTPSGERFITVDAGPNSVFGDDGADVIGTAAGADVLSGGGGSDVMFGGDGDDTLIGGAAADEMTGGAGIDVFSFSINDFAGGGLIVDFITDFEIGVDQIELSGFGITDLDDANFRSLPSGDAIDLGNNHFIVLEGIDSADLLEQDIIGLNQGRQMSLISTTNLHVLTDANDRFVTTDPGANEVFAGAGLDAVIGGAGNDILRGEGDDDVIFGGGGDDRLIGGQGSDELTGRAGADSFEFTSGEETGFAVEFVTDYEAVDTLVFNGFGYSSIDDLSFQNVQTGDLAIALSATRFVVLEGITDQVELTGEFVFG